MTQQERRDEQLSHQHYDKYTQENHDVWKILYKRQIEVLPNRADEAYCEGIEATGFTPNQIPSFEEVNEKLKKITGWSLVVVPGLIDNQPFFNYLKNKQFPATTWLRTMEELDYLEEPDMFHDVFAHVPLLTNKNFCRFLEELSRIALKHIGNEDSIEFISRIYWYTVEFGLINNNGDLRIYGAGILSSAGESVYSLESDIPKRVAYDVKEILHTPYIKDRFQEKYFIINSYKELFDSIPEIEETLDSMLVS
ncbi:phenylalanine 4-monooxygenase [Bernardetia sp. ABR2-2B]|uniref:phenylalanine 4-monooxygenase n=1 Tax=Bernardetia sp. ABR2-2B TaxID=3127472 RepID=UPI0030D601AA